MSRLFGEPLLLLLAGGLAITLICLFFAFGDDGKQKQAKRVDRLKSRSQDQPSGEELQLRKDSGSRGKIDWMVRRVAPDANALRLRLYRTGRHISLGTYGMICAVVAVVTGAGVLISGFSILLALPIGLLTGVWLPHLTVGWLGSRRATRFMALFPDAIGLMVRGLKSGLPITETFQIISQEISDPVGLEFRKVTDQLRLGQPVEGALLDAAKRVGTPELNFLTVTLAIQRETGGNLAETLENLDNVLRRRRQMRLKVRAMSSEARASAMIIGALPFIMVGILSLVNPAYIGLLFSTTAGHKALAIAAVWKCVGIGIMAKMIRFEI